MTPARPVYLDYNAGAPPRPCVLQALHDWPAQAANPSSIHAPGRAAREKIEAARTHVAALVGADPARVVFNSGATEANNTVLKSFEGRRILVSAIEHPSVREAAPHAEQIPATPDGCVDLEALERMAGAGDPPALIAVMRVNNETGVIQPTADVSRLARRCNAALLVDAAQAAGRIAVDMAELGADFLTLSAHKIGGLPGSGALVLGACMPPPVLLHGGGQESRARAGTQNVPGIVAFGLAAREALETLGVYAKIANLRDDLESRLAHLFPDAVFFGRGAARVANTTLFALPGIDSQTALMHLDLSGIAVSAGAACSSGVVGPSTVLKAMGVGQALASSALRVSMGWSTTAQEVDRVVSALETLKRRMERR